jgi:PAS domain S-box-containing protein
MSIENREKAEESLRASENSFRHIVDTIPVLVCTLTAQWELELVNQPLLDYFGKTLDELKNWASIGVVHPDDLEAVIAQTRHSAETGEPYNVEHRCRRYDGVYRRFEVRGVPLRNSQGQIVHWCLLLTDIEDRRRAEEALRSSERSLNSIISIIPELAWSTRPDGFVEYLNQRWLDYTGMSAEEAYGWNWSVALHPDDKGGIVEYWKTLMASGEAGQYEARLRRFDGIYRWFLFRAAPVKDESGNILRWYGQNIEIEDRKRAEEALRASERSLAAIINTIPALVWSARPDGTAEFFNQPWHDYTGLSAEQARDWGWTEAIHPDDLKRMTSYWRTAIISGEPVEIEGRLRRFDGVYRWFLFRASALRDESDSIVKWYGTNTDIDDRRLAEEALRASELAWRKIVDCVPGFVCTATAAGEVELFNQQSLDYFGKTLEDLKSWTTINVIHQDDLPQAITDFRHSLETGQPWDIVHRLRRADGVYRWFQSRGLPQRDAEGRIIRWYGMLSDIDDWKRAESDLKEAYLRLTEAQRLSKTGSFITDLVADEHNWSEEAYRIFEFDPATKVTVQMIRDVILREDIQAFDSMIARAMTGIDVDFEFRMRTSRGDVKHIRGKARVFEQIAGRPLFSGALQDVTEIKVAEEALNQARSELAHVARVTTLNTMTASIAHEINQPLSGIVTNASTCLRILDGKLPDLDGARETARRTIRDANRVSEVISRLRTLFRRKEIKGEPVDLSEATREVIALSLSELQRNLVVLRHELADNLPTVRGDRVQLQQVILNLLRNASDAMSTIENRPRMLFIKTVLDGEHVRLAVQDSGVGFDPEAVDRLFEPFYTTKHDGMGIGLSVSRSIIEAHRGRLWATRDEALGSTFTFSIPCD